MNDRFERNQDGSTDTRTGHDVDDDTFRSFAVWVNNPVSDDAYHNIPDDLQKAVDDVDDPKERQRLRAVLAAYNRREISPRDFVRLIMESDAVDYFDPLAVPDAWEAYDDDGFAGPPEAKSGKLLLDVENADYIGTDCPACGDGELIKGVDGDPLEPANPWCESCGWVVGTPFDDKPFDDHPDAPIRDRIVAGGVTDKGRAPSSIVPPFPWVEIAIGLTIVLVMAAAYVILT